MNKKDFFKYEIRKNGIRTTMIGQKRIKTIQIDNKFRLTINQNTIDINKNDTLSFIKNETSSGFWFGYVGYDTAMLSNPHKFHNLKEPAFEDKNIPILSLSQYEKIDHFKEPYISYKSNIHVDSINLAKVCEWSNMFDIAQNAIDNGEVFQVVLSLRKDYLLNTHPLKVFENMYDKTNSAYNIYVNIDDLHIISYSPELLVSLDNNIVLHKPLAGTITKSGNNCRDTKLLLENKKEVSEHIMLLDLGRNDISRVCNAGTIQVPNLLEVEQHNNLLHISSLVKGELNEKNDAWDVLMAMLPAGTVSGAPKIRAMQLIEQLESKRRLIYGGAIGYIENGKMDMALALRTTVVTKENNMFRYRVQAGAGIVKSSNEVAEYKEIQNKMKIILYALQLHCNR